MAAIEPAARAPVVLRPAESVPVAYSDLDYTISGATAEQLLNADPENTQRAYDRNWSAFETWCAGLGRIALPATPHTLAEYVATLTGISLAPNSIEQAVGTIRSRHRRAGFRGQPDTEETQRLLRAYRRQWADEGGRVRKATPILLPALRAMVETCDDSPGGIRDRSILLLGFNGMCRRSELSGLDQPDAQSAGDDGISLFIRYSKTDQDAEGAEVSIPYGQHAETCAVRATQLWREVLAERGWMDGPLYRPVDRHGRIGDEPMAAGITSPRLSGESVSTVVRRRAVLAALPDPGGYSGHSLRSGAATTAYLAGAPVAEIAKHGRWRENSPVVLGYIRAVDKWKHNPMKGIGL